MYSFYPTSALAPHVKFQKQAAEAAVPALLKHFAAIGATLPSAGKRTGMGAGRGAKVARLGRA